MSTVIKDRVGTMSTKMRDDEKRSRRYSDRQDHLFRLHQSHGWANRDPIPSSDILS